MTDPRPCDRCLRPTERNRMAREVAVGAEDGHIDHRGQFCPRCARLLARQRRFGDFDRWAREATRFLLEQTWGTPLQILWLQEGRHRWLVLARPARPRPRPAHPADVAGDQVESQIPAATPGAGH